MSKIISSIALLQAVFDEHAGKDGDPKTLTKKEVADLLKNDNFPIEVRGKNVAQLRQRAVMIVVDDDLQSVHNSFSFFSPQTKLKQTSSSTCWMETGMVLLLSESLGLLC